jgi:hypothetical protein
MVESRKLRINHKEGSVDRSLDQKSRMMKTNRLLMGLPFLLIIVMVLPQLGVGADEPCFNKSLHYTGAGMRHWYETEGGFMDVTKIPYDDLDCKSCHVKSCDPCHVEKTEGACAYSAETAKKSETCLKCHTRENLTIQYGKGSNMLDVHFATGMACGDCHKSEDVHGQGKVYKSMRDPGAVGTECADCHEITDDIRAHKVHSKNVDCAACHIKNTTACMNCHFDGFLETGSRKGMFLPLEKWTFLVNYEGKVTTGTVMSLVYKDNKFLVYAPYFSHSVQKKGRECSDCHGNAAAALMKEGKSVPVMQFKDGKAVHWEGVIPAVPEKLSYAYLNKVDDKWVPIKNDRTATVQFAGYGKPLTEDQLKKLYMSIK